jgi:hypothetical protein
LIVICCPSFVTNTISFVIIESPMNTTDDLSQEIFGDTVIGINWNMHLFSNES